MEGGGVGDFGGVGGGGCVSDGGVVGLTFVKDWDAVSEMVRGGESL